MVNTGAGSPAEHVRRASDVQEQPGMDGLNKRILRRFSQKGIYFP